MRELSTFLKNKIIGLGDEICSLEVLLRKQVGRGIVDGIYKMSRLADTNGQVALGHWMYDIVYEIQRNSEVTRNYGEESRWFEYQDAIFLAEKRVCQQHHGMQKELILTELIDSTHDYRESELVKLMGAEISNMGHRVLAFPAGSEEACDLERKINDAVADYVILEKFLGKFKYHSHNRVIDEKGNTFIINPVLEIGMWLQEYKNGESR